MKVTKEQLKEIIKEELHGLNESTWSRRQENTDPEGYIDEAPEATDKIEVLLAQSADWFQEVSDTYNSLPDDKSKELFGTNLKTELLLLFGKWEEELPEGAVPIGELP